MLSKLLWSGLSRSSRVKLCSNFGWCRRWQCLMTLSWCTVMELRFLSKDNVYLLPLEDRGWTWHGWLSCVWWWGDFSAPKLGPQNGLWLYRSISLAWWDFRTTKCAICISLAWWISIDLNVPLQNLHCLPFPILLTISRVLKQAK
jgi:hypothetical protein